LSLPRAKIIEYELELDRDGRVSAPGGTALALPPELSPEHLVLAGLARCTLNSLAYHARRGLIQVTSTAAAASGRVTRRDSDSRYAFVDVEVRFDVGLEPAPQPEPLAGLLERAERDCFVGASLTAPPRYVWRVNGENVA
jgi:uncharacterized OsmC-like protein